MEYGPGIPALPIGLLVFIGLFSYKKKVESNTRPFRSALISSVILFGVGGIIGFMIQGINVTIPAHYHGNIVGVTIAFMGFTYYLLPHLGFRKPSARLANNQPYVYGIGNLLLIIGLVWAGGHGIQRKTAGGAQGLENIKEIASMGIGGLIAVIGGFLFLLICILSIWPMAQNSSAK